MGGRGVEQGMANKKKAKRRLGKAIKRRIKSRVNNNFRIIFLKSGILKGKR